MAGAPTVVATSRRRVTTDPFRRCATAPGASRRRTLFTGTPRAFGDSAVRPVHPDVIDGRNVAEREVNSGIVGNGKALRRTRVAGPAPASRLDRHARADSGTIEDAAARRGRRSTRTRRSPHLVAEQPGRPFVVDHHTMSMSPSLSRSPKAAPPAHLEQLHGRAGPARSVPHSGRRACRATTGSARGSRRRPYLPASPCRWR